MKTIILATETRKSHESQSLHRGLQIPKFYASGLQIRWNGHYVYHQYSKVLYEYTTTNSSIKKEQ
ncbi:MAG: hypothetical protein Q4F82_04780 [bacterium]|nr:hypothetical protein [bacterium]